jgi:hypothetical protein
MLVANRPREAAMHTLPTAMIQLLAPFALLFSERVWRYAQVLLAGTILVPGKRTVGAALRLMGLGRTAQYQRYHRVLNRAVWSSQEASRVLLGLLVKTFLAEGEPLVGHRRGRNVGEALGSEDRRQGDLSGPGAFQPRPLREGEWLAMGVPDAPRAGALGFFSGMGLAVSERARSLRALRPRAGQEAPQEANRLGAPDAPVGPALVARTRDRGRGRLRLRLHKAARRLPTLLAQSRSPSSRACAWMQRSTSRPRRANRNR